jgi:hypothetical protein
MAESKMKFAKLLTEAIRTIAYDSNRTIDAVMVDIGYELGRKGGSSIEHWRKGNFPPRFSERVALARILFKKGGFPNRKMLSAFLLSLGHPAPDSLCEELFPMPLRKKSDVATYTGTSFELTENHLQEMHMEYMTLIRNRVKLRSIRGFATPDGVWAIYSAPWDKTFVPPKIKGTTLPIPSRLS